MANVVACEQIRGVFTVEPTVHPDARGAFWETYRREWFPNGREMVQANHSDKLAGTLVGIHYHLHQADYWRVPKGRANVVLIDLREGSPTERARFDIELSEENRLGLFIPPGVSHSYVALTEVSLNYLTDQYYNPADELGIAWDDPDLGIDSEVDDPIVSERDRNNPNLASMPPSRTPYWGLRP